MTQLLLAALVLTSLALGVIGAPVDSQATPETVTLYNVLQKLSNATDRFLFGTMHPTLFGLYGGHKPYWTYAYNGKPDEAWMFNPNMAHSGHPDELCDPCALTHDFPAIAGFDLGMIGNDIEDAWVYLLKKAHERGAIITFNDHTKNLVTGKGANIHKGDTASLHAIKRILPGGDDYSHFVTYMDTIANFIKYKLVDSNGKPIPIIYRPWQESNDGWYWWGIHNDAQNTEDDIKQLYQNTVKYLRDTKGLHNILYATADGCTGVDPATIYPGDDYVDILGIDCAMTTFTGPDTLKAALTKAITRAQPGKKIVAVTEVNVVNGPLTTHPQFFTHDTLEPLTSLSTGVAYMFTLNNQYLSGNRANIVVPYPGHPMEQDYVDFYNDNATFFLSDLKANYPELYASSN